MPTLSDLLRIFKHEITKRAKTYKQYIKYILRRKLETIIYGNSIRHHNSGCMKALTKHLVDMPLLRSVKVIAHGISQIRREEARAFIHMALEDAESKLERELEKEVVVRTRKVNAAMPQWAARSRRR